MVVAEAAQNSARKIKLPDGRALGYVEYGDPAGKPAISSPVLVESVAVRVAFHIRHTRRRGYVRMSGTVAPAEVGSLVGFQRLKPGHRSVVAQLMPVYRFVGSGIAMPPPPSRPRIE